MKKHEMDIPQWVLLTRLTMLYSFGSNRRVLFVGVLPLLSSSTQRRAFIGVFFAVLSLAYYRESEPFLSTSTNTLAGLGSIQKIDLKIYVYFSSMPITFYQFYCSNGTILHPFDVRRHFGD
jgi:hypothetical protein